MKDKVQEQNKSARKKGRFLEGSFAERNEQNRGTKNESAAREIRKEEEERRIAKVEDIEKGRTRELG